MFSFITRILDRILPMPMVPVASDIVGPNVRLTGSESLVLRWLYESREHDGDALSTAEIGKEISHPDVKDKNDWARLFCKKLHKLGLVEQKHVPGHPKRWCITKAGIEHAETLPGIIFDENGVAMFAPWGAL